jgi:putative tricarboxylic transport membrane protein
MGIEGILQGFANAISLVNLAACFAGVFLGTMIGVLPGLGPTATMSLLLPLTLSFASPVTGLIMLAGIWYGAQYGGSTTSILVNIPGESSSVITCIDGNQMSKKGRTGAALCIAAIASFVAGTIGLIGLQFFAPPLAKAALAFGPPEYLCLMVFAFTVLSNLTGSSISKGLVMVFIGFFIGVIGTDSQSGISRFTLNSVNLMGGIDFLPIAMGLFGITEIVSLLIDKDSNRKLDKVRLKDLYPNKEELRRSGKPMLRGSILGFFVGLIPGPGPTISTFLSYSLEKRLSKKHKNEFGKGAVEGVAGPEAANNSAVSGSLVPLLALGIPFAPPAAILLAGMRMQNIEAGPMLFQQNPEIFWGIVASMYLGNIMLLVLNLPLVGLFTKVATIRPAFLMPVVSIFCMIGVYSVRNNVFDIWVMLLAGIVGYFLRRRNYPVAPLILALVLGPTTESAFRNSLVILDGNLGLIFLRPIAATLLLATFIFIFVSFGSKFISKKMMGMNMDDAN